MGKIGLYKAVTATPIRTIFSATKYRSQKTLFLVFVIGGVLDALFLLLFIEKRLKNWLNHQGFLPNKEFYSCFAPSAKQIPRK